MRLGFWKMNQHANLLQRGFDVPVPGFGGTWAGVRANAMEYWSALVMCMPPAESMMPLSSAACDAFARSAEIACAMPPC